ncbi:IclR family transcriptional regulator [Oceaniglobus indicus]|uniref:IclR family transcriptional regulator n=1 Tax=Oceaniglobus indicus TaxID=2047749 RepID=UPI0011AB76B5|nr:IclR family transcriptional regulator [Oceaniglobus indicus]
MSRAASVLRVIGRLGDPSFSQLSRQTGLANATLRRLLVALIDAQLAVQDGVSGRYRLGVEAYLMGQLAAPRFLIHDIARDGLTRLARLSGDTAFLSAFEGISTVCLHREEGQYPIRTHVLSVGDRHPLGMGAAGLAVLAALPVARADAILAANAEAIHAARPEVDMDVLAVLVTDARATGVALNPGLIFPGSWGIAAAIRTASGTVVGALTIAAIEDRLGPDRQAELSTPLLEEAASIERRLARLDANESKHAPSGATAAG